MARSILAVVYLALVLGGIWLGTTGLKALEQGSTADANPTQITLEDIEAGRFSENRYVTIGSHLRLHDLAIYEYSAETELTGSPKQAEADSPLHYTLLPIVSSQHAKVLGNAQNKNISNTGVRRILVIVKTEKFERVADIPTAPSEHASITGYLKPKPDLDGEERKLLKERFPQLDSYKIVVLDHGWKPTSRPLAYVQFVGGICLLVFPLVIMIVRRRRKASS